MAVGCNLCWLLRAIARLGMVAVILRVLQAALSASWAGTGAPQRFHARVGTWRFSDLNNGAGAVKTGFWSGCMGQVLKNEFCRGDFLMGDRLFAANLQKINFIEGKQIISRCTS